ncbi:MAG: type II secretion system protein M [Phycisphaerae bacterium]|nr:type II secretion system protein M [Phycisphaerae bacterium]
MNLTQRDKRALTLGAIGLAAIAGYLLIIEPALTSYDELRATHAANAAKVAKLLLDRQKSVYLSTKLDQWREKAGEFAPPDEYGRRMTVVGDGLVAAVQRGGLQLKHSTWSATRSWNEDPTLALAMLQIDGEAGWENVFKFIAELHRIPGVLSIESLDLSGDPKKGGNLTVRMTVSVLVKAAEKGPKRWPG